MGGVYGGSEVSLTPPKEKKKATDIVINGIPPGAKISGGNDNPASCPSAKGPQTQAQAQAQNPNKGRGGHPTELGEKQGPGFLTPNADKPTNENGKVATLGESAPGVYEIKDEESPEGGRVSLDEQMENINKNRRQKEREQEEKDRVKEDQQDELDRIERNRKMEQQRQKRQAPRGTIGPAIYEKQRGNPPTPGLSGSVYSGDRKVTAPRPSLLDPKTSAQNARVLAAVEKAREYISGKTQPKSTPDPDTVPDWGRPVSQPKPSPSPNPYENITRPVSQPKPSPSPNPYENVTRPVSPPKLDTRGKQNMQALQAIKAFDKKVAPEAEKWEGWSREVVDAWNGLREMAKGKHKGATSAVAVTTAQKNANARIIEALAKTTDNKALASLFADSIMSGSPVAGAVYGDFLQQLGKKDQDLAEAFNEAVADAWGEKAGWDGDSLEGIKELFELVAKEYLKSQGLDAIIPKEDWDSPAFLRERIAREIDLARRKGRSSPLLDIAEENLDKHPHEVTKMWESLLRSPPKSPK